MIPIGYCTIPEAIKVLEDIVDDGAVEWLEAGFLDGELQVFTQRAREYDLETCRVPWEDLKDLSRSWSPWLATGRVPRHPPIRQTPESKAKWDAWYANKSGGPMPDTEYESWTVEHAYERCQLLLEVANFHSWLDALRRQLGVQEQQVAKTGAPGRPSSMHLALAEHRRRLENKLCEGSRTAEAKALAEWLKLTHPDEPPLTYKTILNTLPSEFQPLNGRFPK